MIDWLMDRHGVELELVTGFLYPGHSRLRMHGPKSRTGADLEQSLLAAVSNAGIDLVTGASVVDLFADETGRIRGVRFRRPDGAAEVLGCRALVLACCGFAATPTWCGATFPRSPTRNAAGIFQTPAMRSNGVSNLGQASPTWAPIRATARWRTRIRFP